MTTTQHNGEKPASQSANILVIQPDESAPLGRFTQWLEQAGAEVTVIQPFAGDHLPTHLTADGLMVLGGTMSFNALEQFPWLADINALYRQAATANIPALGICLGAQLLAATFGGRVTVNSSKGPEIGVVDIASTQAGVDDPIMQDLADSFCAMAFHYDGISELPDGAVLLGQGDQYPNQIFRYGTAVGVQFHPEATPELFNDWCAEDSLRKPELTAFFDEQRRQVDTADGHISAQVYKLAQNFVKQIQAAPLMQRS